jgi:hypothetical protein
VTRFAAVAIAVGSAFLLGLVGSRPAGAVRHAPVDVQLLAINDSTATWSRPPAPGA